MFFAFSCSASMKVWANSEFDVFCLFLQCFDEGGQLSVRDGDVPLFFSLGFGNPERRSDAGLYPPERVFTLSLGFLLSFEKRLTDFPFFVVQQEFSAVENHPVFTPVP